MDRAGSIFFAAVLVATSLLCSAALGVAPARAEPSCPGNPDALGTSRVLVVSPDKFKQVGTIQYPQTLPLADHEVVITFDDGPLPPWSDKALDILTSQCVKATFFIIGKMAQQYPQVVRREYEAGYTIGTHSQDHPQPFQKLSGDRLNYEIDAGIASVGAALGDPDEVAPFFRIPGFGRSKAVEDALAARSLVVFCADADADDWLRHITPKQIVERAMSRLEKRGGGILLLHDIHPWTIAALPELLKELKENGFHVVHIVPPAPRGPQIAGGPKAWALAAAMPQARLIDAGGVSPAWPQPNDGAAVPSDALAAPDEAAFAIDHLLRFRALPMEADAGAAAWPPLAGTAPPPSGADLPAPGLGDIGVSLAGARLVTAQIAVQPKPDAADAIGRKRWSGRERVRRVRLRGRQIFERRGRSEEHRADQFFPQSPAPAAWLTPAPARPPKFFGARPPT